jgi:hypothetical protein
VAIFGPEVTAISWPGNFGESHAIVEQTGIAPGRPIVKLTESTAGTVIPLELLSKYNKYRLRSDVFSLIANLNLPRQNN